MSHSKYHGVEDHVGRTPLIRLRRVSEITGCEILGKAEFMNPGGSVKDRAALGIISDAESRGLLRPGSTIVEGTAGSRDIAVSEGTQSANRRRVCRSLRRRDVVLVHARQHGR